MFGKHNNGSNLLIISSPPNSNIPCSAFGDQPDMPRILSYLTNGRTPPNKLYYSKKNLQNLKIIKLPNKM